MGGSRAPAQLCLLLVCSAAVLKQSEGAVRAEITNYGPSWGPSGLAPAPGPGGEDWDSFYSTEWGMTYGDDAASLLLDYVVSRSPDPPSAYIPNLGEAFTEQGQCRTHVAVFLMCIEKCRDTPCYVCMCACVHGIGEGVQYTPAQYAPPAVVSPEALKAAVEQLEVTRCMCDLLNHPVSDVAVVVASALLTPVTGGLSGG
jgi:hypothetical protein